MTPQLLALLIIPPVFILAAALVEAIAGPWIDRLVEWLER